MCLPFTAAERAQFRTTERLQQLQGEESLFHAVLNCKAMRHTVTLLLCIAMATPDKTKQLEGQLIIQRLVKVQSADCIQCLGQDQQK